jgi:hypothetical protein
MLTGRSVSRASLNEPIGAAADRPTAVFDYDFHGLVGVRLRNASSSQARGVARQIGSPETTLDRDPEIVVTFVPRLPERASIGQFSVGDTRFAKDRRMFVPPGRVGGRALINFDDIGRTCEIVCEYGVSSVPFLVSIVNVTAMTKGFIPVHASAFIYRRAGVLVGGWSRGGKTTTMLTFMAEGAEYISDEWVYVADDGRRMYGGRQPISISGRHLADLPSFRARIGAVGRSRLRLANWVRAANRFDSSRLARFTGIAEERLATDVSPEQLFGEDACTLAGVPDNVLIVVRHESTRVVVEDIASEDAARALAASSRYERLPLLSSYLKFRFAFPDAVNALIEQAEELEFTALLRALEGKRAYIVYHPFPPPSRMLLGAIEPLF